jgi:acetyltransferase-like isoleucine patch superfamily enzyme
MPGCYIQGIGKIYIGDYTQISANVGIISANHDVYDNRKHKASEVRIGKYCWIAMNTTILPGVTLGDFTIVGAGAVVTKSFTEGYCVIAGNPARLIRRLDPASCVRHRSEYEYNGYLRHADFDAFRRARLAV